MDYTQQSALQNGAQMSEGLDAAIAERIESRLRDVHTCLPGTVISFDAAKQTAQVQPAIKRIFIDKGPVNLPPCVDVPVKFPGGGGFFLTFPVKAGDECVLHFSERAIDFWWAHSGEQLPAEYRLHDLSDAFADVGVNSLPNAIQNLCTTGSELRTRDGQTFVRVESGTITIKGNVVVHGSIAADQDVTGQGTSLHSHTHKGVQTGSGNTGVPN